MENYSEEILDKEFKKIAEDLGFSENPAKRVENKNPIDLATVLYAHKLLKENSLWKLLPKKEALSVRK